MNFGESVELAKKVASFPDPVCNAEESITKAAQITRVAYLCGFHNGIIKGSEFTGKTQ